MCDIADDKPKYIGLCKRLAPNKINRKKGTEEHFEFLTALLDRQAFLSWYEQRMGPNEIPDIRILDNKLSENDFRDLSPGGIPPLYDLWKDTITPALACKGWFWSRVTYLHIKEGVIEAEYLAHGEGYPNGRPRIEDCLGNENPEEIDKAVRDSMRHLGGLHNVRGVISTYSDCIFAKAWWKGYYAHEVSKKLEDCVQAPISADDIFALFRRGAGDGIWNRLIDLVVRQNATFGYRQVNSALIWLLSELPEKSLKTGAGIAPYSNKLKSISSTRELGVYPVEKLKKLIEDAVPSDGASVA